MKKLNLLLLGLLLSTFALSAQDTDKKSAKIPQKGNWMVELTLDNPFRQADFFRLERLQGKYWFSDNMVFRLGLNFDSAGNKRGKNDYKDQDGNMFLTKESSFTFGINPGIEYRLIKGRKVSPYLAFELALENRSSKARYEAIRGGTSSVTEIKNVWDDGTQWGYFSFGANLLFGTDFFIWKNVYFGFELGLSYETTKFKKTKETVGDASPTYTPSFRQSEFGVFTTTLLRLGVWF